MKKIIECGTFQGYNKHTRKKEKACRACKDAYNLKQNIWRSKNPKKTKKYHAKYYALNSEKEKQRVKKHYQLNLEQASTRVRVRRARRLGNGFVAYSKFDVLETYGTKCYVCMEEIDLDASRRPGYEGWQSGLHIDHLVPISQGGADILENVRPTHGLCNLKKSTKTNYLKSRSN